jgi:sortase (surface protein transpeptidase)
LAGFTIYQWHCAAEPGPQPADGTVCNPVGPEHYEPFVAPVFANLTVNSADIPCGGWVCRDQISGNSTIVSTNDLLEGGVDLQAVPFTGCFNTFLPHSRTAQSFTSVLTDFAGPIGFKSCRNPATTSNSSPTGSVSPGASVHDTVTVANGGAGFTPTGTVRFFLCTPAQVTGAGCPTGTQVGAVKTLVGGGATSDSSTATNAAGKYCWRTVYTPDAASTGVYAPATHTNATTECFNVAAAVNLPNTGGDPQPSSPWTPLQALLVGPALFLSLLWRRSRSVAILLIAGVIAGSSPAAPSTSATARDIGVAQTSHQVEQGALPPQLGTVKAKAMGWRLVIPRIGVDALIQSVGRDSRGAMASPTGLDVVGWYRHGPSPGQAGDAVIDGHFGLPAQPAVFRDLRLLRPGDAVHVIWPDGRTVAFQVTTSETVAATAHPAGLFARNGPARISLITCGGEWDQSLATYTDRLIVTAVPT